VAHAFAVVPAEFEPDRVADDRADDRAADQQPQIGIAPPRQEAGEQHHRLPGQHDAQADTRLSGSHQEHHHISPRIGGASDRVEEVEHPD
jgi:hypothetical protein